MGETAPPGTKPLPAPRQFVPTIYVACLTSALAVAVNSLGAEGHGRSAWIVVVILTMAGAVATVLASRGEAKGIRAITAVMIVTTVLIGLLTAGLRFMGPSCPAFCYDFENGTAGWGIRTEADGLLGKHLSTSEAVDAGSLFDHRSLAFTFQLGGGSPDHAQVKIETVVLSRDVTASLYLPAHLPPTVVVSAFVLEHNDQLASDRPEWVFYQTNPKDLRSGAWSRITFTRDLFAIVGYWPSGRWTQVPVGEFWHGVPFMVGLELRDSRKGPVGGTVYLDEISIR
jgi:lysylphosphatidylglycerol synthetase-like protein (DUF2156 family)